MWSFNASQYIKCFELIKYSTEDNSPKYSGLKESFN